MKVPLVTVESVYPQSIRPKRSFRPCRRFTGGLCPFRRGVGINRRCAGNNANLGRLRERRFYRFPGLCPGQAERPAVRSVQLALSARFAASGKSVAFRAVAPLPKKSCDFSGTP